MKTRDRTPAPAPEAKPKCSSYNRVKAYRQRLKEKPEKKDELKQIDRLRKQEERKKTREQIVKDKRLLAAVREKKTQEMRRYRAKIKKAQEAQEAEDPTAVGATTARSQAGKATAQKKKATQMKRKQRETENNKRKMEELKKKGSVLRVQNWRLRIQMKSNSPSTTTTCQEGEVGHLSEDQDEDGSLAAAAAATPTMVIAAPRGSFLQVAANEEPPMAVDDNPFGSYWKERRAVIKSRDQLPHTPAKRAHVVAKLMSSPRTAKFLRVEKGLPSKAKRQLEVGKALVNAFDQGLADTKHTGTGKHVQARAYRQLKLIASTSSSLRRYFKLRKARKPMPEWWKDGAGRQKRKDRVSDTVREGIAEFYLLPEISRQVPNKREVVNIQDKEGRRVKVQKHVMTMTLGDAFKEYRAEHPRIKVGFSTFKSLKPPQVRKVSETSRRTCLCTTCCNIALKVEVVRKIAKKCADEKTEEHSEQNEEEQTEEPDLGQFLKLTKSTVAAMTLCPHAPLPPRAKCLDRTCTECGTDQLRGAFQPLLEMYGEEPVIWHKWTPIKLTKKGAEKRCISCVPQTTSLDDLVTDFAKGLEEYPAHIFRADWQHAQMTECTRNLKAQDVAVVMDFSENYTCRFQNEVQSAFFDQNQVTLHPMMNYYMKEHNDEEVRVRHVIIGVSDDTRHDTCLVRKFQAKAATLVLQHTPAINQLQEWTDGCAAQYKGKAGFADISLHGIPTQRNFFETSHGKNVCDGLGAVMKNVCYQAVVTGKAVLGRAEDVFSYLQTTLAHKAKEVIKAGKTELSIRDFVYVSADETEHDRAELQVKTLDGTQKLHSVKNTKDPYVVQTRNLACFCSGCCKVPQEECLNKEYVQPWAMYELKMDKKKKKKAGDANAALPQPQPIANSAKDDHVPDNHNDPGTPVTPPGREDVNGGGLLDLDVRNAHASGTAALDVLNPGDENEDIGAVVVGDFVAVALYGKRKRSLANVFMAEVTSTNDDSATVKYMTKLQANLYQWPLEEDLELSTESMASLTKMDKPELVDYPQKFSFKQINMDKVSNLMKAKNIKFTFK